MRHCSVSAAFFASPPDISNLDVIANKLSPCFHR
jgi:hypothetical protein